MNLKKFNWSSEEYDGLFEKKVPSQLLQNPLLQKDIWRTVEDLDLDILEHEKVLIFNFSEIQPPWLKILAKLYILKKVNLKISANTISGKVYHLKKLSIFLVNNYIYKPKYIDNQFFEEFDNWIRQTRVKKTTIVHYYITFKDFFDNCRTEGWLEVNTSWFHGRCKGIETANNIDYLPEDIWHQLEENLHHLAEPMQKKVLIIRTLGLRVGELLNLPLDCLRKRDNQWRLRLKETEKFHIEDEIPLPKELLPIIKEQQKFIQYHFEDNYKKLFCANKTGGWKEFYPTPKVMASETFNRRLNNLAKNYNIKDKNGNLWKFRSHQFRRTVATIMTNAGVRDLIIQKYLRHRNPDMQNYYKHLFKEVIGDEYQELTKEQNFVNIEGKIVATRKPQDAIEEYMRLRMHQITTQQGECHRNNLKKPCPTVNSCWRCGDWMTSEKDLPYLKQDLERLKNELKKANKLRMTRIEKEINKDINHIKIRMNTLEKLNKDREN